MINNICNVWQPPIAKHCSITACLLTTTTTTTIATTAPATQKHPYGLSKGIFIPANYAMSSPPTVASHPHCQPPHHYLHSSPPSTITMSLPASTIAFNDCHVIFRVDHHSSKTPHDNILGPHHWPHWHPTSYWGMWASHFLYTTVTISLLMIIATPSNVTSVRSREWAGWLEEHRQCVSAQTAGMGVGDPSCSNRIKWDSIKPTCHLVCAYSWGWGSLLWWQNWMRQHKIHTPSCLCSFLSQPTMGWGMGFPQYQQQ